MAELVNACLLVTFVLLLGVAAGTTSYRLVRYRHVRVPVPLLLWRDAALTCGLALPFAAILVARTLGVGSQLAGSIVWGLATGLPAIAGMAVYVWFELRVIDRDRTEDDER